MCVRVLIFLFCFNVEMFFHCRPICIHEEESVECNFQWIFNFNHFTQFVSIMYLLIIQISMLLILLYSMWAKCVQWTLSLEFIVHKSAFVCKLNIAYHLSGIVEKYFNVLIELEYTSQFANIYFLFHDFPLAHIPILQLVLHFLYFACLERSGPKNSASFRECNGIHLVIDGPNV